MPRRLPLVLLLAALVLPGCRPVPPSDLPVVDVYEISGPLDQRGIDYLTNAIRDSVDSVAVILQIDSPSVLDSDLSDLDDLLRDPPVPVAVWVGPAPAVAYDGALELLAAASIKLASPGVLLGYRYPILTEGLIVTIDVEPPTVVDGPIDGLVDDIPAAPKQAVLALDGRVVNVGGRDVILETATKTATDADELTVEVRFHQPDLLTRFLRLAVTPEAAFFFLAAGLTVVAFEFFAIGPGVGGAVALLSLLLGGYGVSVLPVRWWAVGLALLSLWLLSASFQRGRVFAMNAAGLVGLAFAGYFFVDGWPQLTPNWWGIGLTVAAVAFFFLIALPAVGRSRFSTPAIGREHLVGMTGVAVVDHRPDGVVAVGGGRWPSTAHREAKIKTGDRIRVREVDGRHLAVEPEPEG